MEPAASSPRGALPTRVASRKRRRSQSPPPAGEAPSEPVLARPRFGDNLDLILSLQGKELSLIRKIELAFNFITTESSRSSYGHRADNIQLSRMVSFIGNWVQSILILPEKKVSESFDPILDYRCWVILRFCIEKKPSVSISLNLLKTLGRVANHGLSRVNIGVSCGDDESFELFKRVLECMSFLFFSNTRAFFNAGVDLWTFCIIEAINLVQKVSPNEKNDCTVLQNFANCLLEQFSSFLRFYANPKNIFRTFVDKILDPLLELLVLLNSQANSIKHKQAGTTLKIVEEILSNGLFHPQHLSGYFGLKNLNKASIAKDVRGSYHRHLFERFKGIKAESKAVLLAGFGNLLQLFVSRARSQTTSLTPRGTSFKSPQKSSVGSEEPQHHRESLFEVFMQFMEPLVLECKSYSQKDFSNLGVTKLVEVHCMLKSINEILTTVTKEKLYVPTEDTSEGSYLQFLQDIYRVLILMSEKMYDFWVSAVCSEDMNVKKMLPLVFVEIVVAVGHFVEIEYKVMGGDLVKLWSMIFALSAINASSTDIKPCFLLTSKISSLSAQVIHTFSELRQVAHSICMLCNSVRTLSAVAGPDVVPGPFSVVSLSSHKCLESLATLLSSQTLRDAIYTSINSMPEGQSSRCIEELTVDLTGTLKWMESCSEDIDLESQGKSRSSARKSVFNQKAELFGRHLSELYTDVLDSVTVTPSNTTLVAKSVERLVNAIRPNLTQLVRNESINLSEFIRSVVGKNLSDKQCVSWQKISSLSWLFVFFFRIYTSCRSLYRQCVGLMPPDLAIEATELMGISFTACCGNEWTNTANITVEGYFSWVVESSGSLLDGIKILSQSIPTNHSGFTMLVYILHVMALQRLNDLNRQINAFDFLLEDDTHQLDEDRGNTELLKESCCLEAARLTNFMMSYVRILSSGENSHFRCYELSSSWDLSICSLDEGSFPMATWRLLCENIDIWSSHASKKDLKNFFSNLIKFSFVQKKSCKDEENSSCRYSYREITLQTISVELLCDAIIYDRKVLLKNLTSSFCHALKKSVSSFVTRADEDNALLDISPDLMEILNKMDSEKLFSTYPDATHAHRVDKYQICENLLIFFSTAPGFHSNSKSFLRLITYIVHLERLLLLALLSRRYESCNPIELICLFICCRRAMKNLVLKFGEEYPESKQFSAFSKLVGNSYSLIWLLRSVQEIVGLSHKIFEAHTDQKKNTLFSLVDTTSEIFSILANMNSRFCLMGPEKKNGSSLKHSPSESNTSEHDGQTFGILESSALEYVKTMAEQLEKTTTGIPVTLKGRNCVIKIENCYSTVCWDKLLCTMSCIGGFLWGLISALESTIKDSAVSSSEERKSMLQYASNFSISIAKFETFVDICLHVLFMENKGCESVDLMSARLPQELECENGFLNIDVVMDGCTMHEPKVNGLQSDVLPSIPSESHYVGPFKIQCMKRSLLENLLNGEGPFVAFTLRELYSVSAAIAKLKGLLSFPSNVRRQACNPFEQLSMGPMVGTAYIALQKIADMSNWPDMYSLVWIDGILRYLEVIGTLPEFSLSKELYAQIVNAHMRAIGKCIILQGKSATLPTHEIGSSTKTLHLKNTSGYVVTRNVIDRQNRLNSLKSRLRLSMRKFVNVTSNMHLSATLQVIERALVGVNQYSHSIYEVKTGTFDGGTVSSDVAAGIDCLYLVLESVPGNKRVFKRTVPDLVGALFNIVLHLQTPLIFYMEKLPPLYPGFHPDAGAVVLMCVEVITAFVGRHTFQINACHVSQCLHLPVTLFKGFKHLLAGRSGSCLSEISRGQTVGQPVESKEYILDRQFSIDMYAACCKLLCTALRHQQREVGRCVAVLEDSVNILLSCLESSDSKMVSLAGYFAWNKEETIKCASFFRRIYEEMRQQRETLGKHSMHFLAGYISMFSGQGPFQTGITREIDEALRPGVYSLIDICEESDFQQLHTYLGEGPCRTTLANLVHDYKLHFQYQGKI